MRPLLKGNINVQPLPAQAFDPDPRRQDRRRPRGCRHDRDRHRSQAPEVQERLTPLPSTISDSKTLTRPLSFPFRMFNMAYNETP